MVVLIQRLKEKDGLMEVRIGWKNWDDFVVLFYYLILVKIGINYMRLFINVQKQIIFCIMLLIYKDNG
jgi:hypothetical protein